MNFPFRSKFQVFLVIGSVFFFAFLLAQLIRPELGNPPVVADLQAPEPVKQILVNSCYNCHSNETKLPWFDQIVPAYWLVVHDIRTGRAHLNFSEFAKMPPAQQKGLLYESINQIQLGAMPPKNYTFVHPKSVITPEQLAVLKNYLHPEGPVPPSPPARVEAANAQYEKWIKPSTPMKDVAPSPNGLAFFSDYKSWKPLSTTDRFDNSTLRVILGNEIAVQAVAENRIQPWPDGAAFAKIAWVKLIGDKGKVQPGEFLQVEFMVKDAKKYAATEGWGFGRWKTMDLVPYGKNSDFATECISCHRPMQANDFVFTTPIKNVAEKSDLFNTEAALPADLPYQPFTWKVISSSVDHEQVTMSTLYGNDLAAAHARSNPLEPYPPGAVLSLVTWKQQEDKHWFGGNIPGKVDLIEFVSIPPAATGSSMASYQSYTGSPLQKRPGENEGAVQARAGYILNLRASVMP